jgi:uncharacterized protein YjcR
MTERQEQAAALYAQGLSTYEIAERMGVKPEMVRRHLAFAGVPRRDRGDAIRLRLAKKKSNTPCAES